MWVIGDVHGQFARYRDILSGAAFPERREELSSSLQLGDMGILKPEHLEELSDLSQHCFFRGNHDNPDLCYESPRYVGDWGFLEGDALFWLAGAQSSANAKRTRGIDLFEDEQLSAEELEEALQQYAMRKPAIVVTHEAPRAAREQVLAVKGVSDMQEHSRTALALHEMFELHQPERWIFGHFHQRADFEIQGTKFTCLDELVRGQLRDCVIEIPGLDLS